MNSKRLPVILSLPHGGLDIPLEIADRIAIDDTTIYNECDLWVDRLFHFEPAPLAVVTMPIARVFVDANRHPQSLDDPDGAVKTQTSYGAPIYHRKPSEADKARLLDGYWRPFHARLDEAVRVHSGEAKLILDCHNMAQHGPSAYNDPGRPRPLICLANLGDETGAPKGAQSTSCSQSLIQRAAESARRLFADIDLLEPVAGQKPDIVAMNRPFAGAYILRRVTGPLPALMVEVNRGLFVGDQTASTPTQPPNEERIAAIRSRLRRWVNEVIVLAEDDS